MPKLIRLSDHRRSQRRMSFDRGELNLLLGLYSRGVSRGDWRDYAIDHGAAMAVFSVFQRAEDRPVFAVAKCADAPGVKGGYVLMSGRRILKKGRTLREVLAGLEPRLKVVASADSGGDP